MVLGSFFQLLLIKAPMAIWCLKQSAEWKVESGRWSCPLGISDPKKVIDDVFNFCEEEIMILKCETWVF